LSDILFPTVSNLSSQSLLVVVQDSIPIPSSPLGSCQACCVVDAAGTNSTRDIEETGQGTACVRITVEIALADVTPSCDVVDIGLARKLSANRKGTSTQETNINISISTSEASSPQQSIVSRWSGNRKLLPRCVSSSARSTPCVDTIHQIPSGSILPDDCRTNICHP
jgi:hypothetical protein